MTIKIIGDPSANVVDTDSNTNVGTIEGLPIGGPMGGGYYSVGGGPSAVVGISLAVDACLVAMRFSTTSLRKAYLYKFRMAASVATLGTAALVTGQLALQRFWGNTMTGGTARVPNLQAGSGMTGPDMVDIRDNNAGLTVPADVTFGNEIARTVVPLWVTSNERPFEWIFDPPYPLVLQPGDGVALRCRVVMPITQTWIYTFDAHWRER